MLNTIKGITRGPQRAYLVGIIAIALEGLVHIFHVREKGRRRKQLAQYPLRTRDRFLKEGE
ncbi:MAG: hypothetical protein LUP95_01475 [Euryarchaeota archaeon]|nr:hypothetical protein [Euryarchaeota archaeon]